MNLIAATSLAEKFLAEIGSFCIRAEIAGSIRRKRPEVKDVEIVAIPKWINRRANDLFGSPLAVNLLYEWAESQTIVQWIKPGTSDIQPWPVKPNGKYWRGLFPDGTKLDLFLANETNWGVIFAIRTGSAEFSEGLVTHARFKTQYIVEGGYLRRVDVSGIIPCTEEARLFETLNLEWIEPEKRNGRMDVREQRRCPNCNRPQYSNGRIAWCDGADKGSGPGGHVYSLGGRAV